MLRKFFVLVVVLALMSAAAGAEPALRKMHLKVVEEDVQAASSYYDFGTGELVVEPVKGHVEIVFEKTLLSALKARINSKDSKVVLSGSVSVAQDDVVIKGDLINALLEEELYTVEGNAHVVQDEKLEITAEWIEVSAETKDLKARGKVKVIEESRTAWADEVEYSEAEQTLVLTGNVRVEVTEDNIHIVGRKIVMNMETEMMQVFGPWEAEVAVEQEDKDN